MGPAVKLDFEWQEAPGVRDKVSRDHMGQA
jgi:hypothetical protein